MGDSPKKVKLRLDAVLVSRGLAPSREKALALIMAGDIRVEGQVVQKPDVRILPDSAIVIRQRYPYVSRGAFKIEKAIRDFSIELRGKRVLDVGISTGGFTDFLLKHGASEIMGVDVSLTQVDQKVKNDPRVKLIEKNARYLKKTDLAWEPDLIVMDVSFISILKILPALAPFEKSAILALIKPQFEAEKGRVGKRGVIQSKERRLDILLRLKKRIEAIPFSVKAVTAAGIKGKKGNQEYFLLLEYGKTGSVDDTIIQHVAEG
jgi:23S rRNA (cytidine1920-2'-O)/16S rRNA (cytidine1409-2'-O)-methyltransferase